MMMRRFASGRHNTITEIDGMVPWTDLVDQPLLRDGIELLHPSLW
jgi:hypothetical protein